MSGNIVSDLINTLTAPKTKEDVPDDLKCPITYGYMEDAITLPCCGRAISRQPLKDCFHDKCVICNADLSHVDLDKIPTSKNIMYLIEQHKQGILRTELDSDDDVDSIPDTNDKIQAKIKYMIVNNKIIGQLELVTDKEDFKTLLCVCVDKSGSMSGAPINQVKYSLIRVLDKLYNGFGKNIVANIIPYADTASIIPIDITKPMSHYVSQVNDIDKMMGGTNFLDAYKKILEIIKDNKDTTNITSLTILFLTDGCGNASSPEAVALFKKQITDLWDKHFVLHSIGFCGSHDYTFLNNLRMIGTEEGSFRFADPNEDTDALSHKVNGVLDVVMTTQSIPIKLVETDKSIPLLTKNSNDGKYWVNLTGKDLSAKYEYKLVTDDKEEIVSPSIEIYDPGDEGDNNKLVNQWYSYLIDQIANELTDLNTSKDEPIVKDIHFEILMRRSRAILIHLDSTSQNATRLNNLIETITIMKSGGVIDAKKLNDMKFEGKFGGAAAKQGNAYHNDLYQPGLLAAYNLSQRVVKSYWATIPKLTRKRCFGKNGIFRELGLTKTDLVCETLKTLPKDILATKDEYDSDLLLVASSIGRFKIVETLLNLNYFNINSKNKEGYSPLDLAILYGYSNTTKLLLDHGATFIKDVTTLFNSCISNKFYRTAKVLLNKNLVTITDNMINNCPNNDGVVWLSNNSQKEITLENAILKGMADKVEEIIKSVKTEKFSLKPFLEIFKKASSDHVIIIDLLMKNDLIDINEIIKVKDEVDGEDEIVFPLFLVCEKGQYSMFKCIIDFCKATINQQNLKGTNPLWIASCNRHVDIVSELLGKGVDPNITNFKGDAPLITACQKSSPIIVQMLLESGASLKAYNKNRDNAVLICCRTGQSAILEMLLSKIAKTDKSELENILNFSAQIDGFDPLHSAVELDKYDCIDVCIKFGANIEAITADDNPITSGATPLHLACFYGRTASVKRLYEFKANMTAQTTVDGYNCLHIAIKQGHKNTVQYLLSLKEGRDCLDIKDNFGRLPSYYANIAGNEEIYNEFINKLGQFLEKSLYMTPEIEQKCSQLLINYGQSYGCYDYDDITNMDIESGETLLTKALLNGNMYYIKALLEMKTDLYKKDDFGISPSFWIKYLNCEKDLSINILDDETDKMIYNVMKVAEKNMQNKMLTNLGGGKAPLLLDDTSFKMLPLVKMEDGFCMKIKDSVLKSLKSLKSVNHSLLGFVEKFNQNKIIPIGKQNLEFLLYNAKIAMIKRIAIDEKEILEPRHIIALFLYTSNLEIFQQVNKILQNWYNKDSKIWEPFIMSLYQGIELLPPFIGEVYRGVKMSYDPKLFAVGNILLWDTFSIATKNYSNCIDLINNKLGMIFIIKSKNGRLIDKYSQNPVDEEVIFLPESSFKITNHYISSNITLGQRNIRESTYKMTNEYMDKVLSGKASIIIELEEIEVIEKMKDIKKQDILIY
jgi:ankyrin repeat protein